MYGGRRGRKEDPLSELFFCQVGKLVQSKRHIPVCVCVCVCSTYKISIGQSVKNMSGSLFFVEDVELLNISLVGEKHYFSTAGCSFEDTPAACVKNRLYT